MNGDYKKRILTGLAISWGYLGVGLLLLGAIYRLSVRASALAPDQLNWYHWLALILGIGFMAYSEGYRGFQQAFCPRVAARARFLKNHADFSTTILAPFFLMGYFRSTTKRKVVVISLTTVIVLLVVLVRQIPSPWREIIDLAVVAGLSWGVISLAIFSVQALTAPVFHHSAEVPGYDGSKIPADQKNIGGAVETRS